MHIACLARKWKGKIIEKIRSYLVAIALIASLSGFTFLSIGAESIANVASSHHVSASTRSVAFIPKPWCPSLGIAC